MAKDIETRLRDLGVELPMAAAPAANYVPSVTSGNLIFVSGQIPVANGSPQYLGKLGRDVSVEDGQAAARLCAINILANLKAALGSLERISRVVKLTGFVNAVPEFEDSHKVINGASDFIVEVLGDAGRHARSAMGVATLPLGVAVEVEAIVEIKAD